MAETFLSQSWYRVGRLRPRLRGHARIHRHRYRGEAWYVLVDPVSGRTHRFTPAAYMFLGRLDGTCSVDEAWREIAGSGVAEAPSQDDVIRLLSQLHQADLLYDAVPPDVAELLERHERQSFALARQNLLNPLSFRVPLIDPDRFLARTLPIVRPLLGWAGLVLWLVIVTAGAVTAVMAWPELSSNLDDRVLAAENLLIVALCYPFVKALHELAHGYLAKARGAEVREMGIMFLVFFPVPYVDASAAAAFRNKWHRAAVGAGGIFVELLVAALAVIAWTGMEPGFARAVAFNLALIGGVSTLLVNGNPLLRFDGYYVLGDLIEIPNLGQRSNRYLGHLVERWAFRATALRPFVATRGERIWFCVYAPLAFVYRIAIMLTIALFVAGKFFVIGVVIALWAIVNALVLPIAKGLHHVVRSPRLRRVRRRAVTLTIAPVAATFLLLATVPAPLITDSEGVVWLPESAHVRAETSGFAATPLVGSGTAVVAGQLLLRLADPTLDARLEQLQWRVRELELRLAATEVRAFGRAELVRVELEAARAERDRAAERAAELELRAPVAGRFVPAVGGDRLAGRWVQDGDLLGYVLPPIAETARVVVRQHDIALVRNRLEAIHVKLIDRLESAYPARLERAVPAALDQLPSPALGTIGGGRIPVDPADADGVRALERVFTLDLALPATLHDVAFGTRVLVRFRHTPEPLAHQLLRRVRQLFLQRFDA